jgi:hypothetical protein
VKSDKKLCYVIVFIYYYPFSVFLGPKVVTLSGFNYTERDRGGGRLGGARKTSLKFILLTAAVRFENSLPD